MTKARITAWIVYTSLFPICADGTFWVPRAVHRRIVRFEGEPPWWNDYPPEDWP